MQIQSTKNFNCKPQKPNFTAKPLYDVTLMDKLGRKGIKATVVELEKGNSQDILALEEVEKQCDHKNGWKPGAPDQIFFTLFDHFKDRTISGKDTSKYYAVTIPDGKNSKILGCMNASINNTLGFNKALLDDLYVSNNFAHRNSSRDIKGVGEVLVSQAIKFAKEAKAKTLDFLSLADNFYIHSFTSAKLNNTRTENSSNFHVNSSEFNKYLDFCNKKYGK